MTELSFLPWLLLGVLLLAIIIGFYYWLVGSFRPWGMNLLVCDICGAIVKDFKGKVWLSKSFWNCIFTNPYPPLAMAAAFVYPANVTELQCCEKCQKRISEFIKELIMKSECSNLLQIKGRSVK